MAETRRPNTLEGMAEPRRAYTTVPTVGRYASILPTEAPPPPAQACERGLSVYACTLAC
jgi:hypothetical protein